MIAAPQTVMLLVRLRGILGAFPISTIVETLRPLPVEPLAGAPPFVPGLAVLRGSPVPVVDLALLLGLGPGRSERLVVVRAGTRRAALLVDGVVGLRSTADLGVQDVPPLLSRAAREVIEAVGVLDDQLLAVLHSARLISEAGP